MSNLKIDSKFKSLSYDLCQNLDMVLLFGYGHVTHNIHIGIFYIVYIKAANLLLLNLLLRLIR